MTGQKIHREHNGCVVVKSYYEQMYDQGFSCGALLSRGLMQLGTSDEVSNVLWPREGHYHSLLLKFFLVDCLKMEFKLFPRLLLGESIFMELNV